MSKRLQRMLLVPSVIRLATRAPRNPHTAWEGYWRGIDATGRSGDVLWDSGSRTERDAYAAAVVAHFDPTLPVVDVGCGNGTHSRWLAALFPSVLGIDVSSGAVERANSEAEGLANVNFMELDATKAGAGQQILERTGPANIFVRGVLHILKPDKQASLAANLRTAIGDRGRVYLAETNFQGNSLAYLQELGATRGNIPRPLRRALENLPRPGHFGAAELRAAFPAAEWRMVADGPIAINVVPMNPAGLSQQVPGYFAVLAGEVRAPRPTLA